MATNLLEHFQAARAVSTPLIAIRTADPEGLMQKLQKANNEAAILQWDVIRGWRARNDEGKLAISYALKDTEEEATLSPVEHLALAQKLPFDDESVEAVSPILFAINIHRFLDKPEVVQAICNLRDPFATSGRTLVMLGPDFKLPQELQQDVLVLDAPLPKDDELKLIVNRTIKASGVKVEVPKMEAAVDAIRGLAAFPAEQAIAMSLCTGQSLDLDELWQKKRQMIRDTDALSIHAGKETFKDIGGCDQVKEFLLSVKNGKESPRVIIFMDEIEKAFAGASSDWVGDGGVAKDAHGQTLQFMEDKEADGVIFVGPPGAAKSLVAKSFGNEASIPTITLDLGAAKGGIVGESEAKIRNAYKIIDAVGAGRCYFIATSNNIAVLPPELKRRFTSGIFYFPIPDEDNGYRDRLERDRIWAIYLKKWKLDASQLKEVNDSGWTGAEIRNCARMAYRQSITLGQAAKYIVPYTKTSPEKLELLRREATGRYLSANRAGIYTYSAHSTKDVGGAAPRRFQPIRETVALFVILMLATFISAAIEGA